MAQYSYQSDATATGAGKFLQLVKCHTISLVCNDPPWDHKIVAVVDKWSLFRGQLSTELRNIISKVDADQSLRNAATWLTLSSFVFPSTNISFKL